MIAPTQKIKLTYKNRLHWFEVYRFDTEKELHAALYKAGTRDFPKKTVAYSNNYAKGEECGRMYLLDTSINTLASVAADMASGILARHGFEQLKLTTKDAQELETDYFKLVGKITSELYSKSKYY